MLNPSSRISHCFAVSLLCATSLLAEQTLAGDNDLRIKNTASLRYAVGGQYFGALSNPVSASSGYVESRVAKQHNVTTRPTFVRTARVAAQPGPIQLSLLKSQEVFDANGDPMLVSGSRILYRLEITGVGAGTATSIVVTDPVPANTTYIANSMRLNGEPLTDDPGDDGGQILAGTPDLVQVAVGNITEGGGSQVVEFEVLVN